jgi:hypothetical protein
VNLDRVLAASFLQHLQHNRKPSQVSCYLVHPKNSTQWHCTTQPLAVAPARCTVLAVSHADMWRILHVMQGYLLNVVPE